MISPYQPKELMYLKRGEYFSFTMSVLNIDTPIDILLADVAAQVRTKAGALVDECTIEQISIGNFKFFVADTNDWPIGVLEMDIDISYNSQPFSSTTYLINVVRDITRPV